jgi:dihydroorotate dehydrogenase (NAD+) catalytic subunit
MEEVDLSVEIGGVKFENPIFVASGTFGYGNELLGKVNVERLGAIVTKGITVEPREGNPPPRLTETPCGLLNSIGLENVGLNAFLEEKLPRLAEIGIPIVVNIEGSTIEEYETLAERLDRESSVTALELNVSCPNVERGGIEFGKNPKVLEELVFRVKRRIKKPVWVKLTPNWVDVVEEGLAAQRGGADAVTAINTLYGMAVDVRSRRFKLFTKSGGLSGPAIHPVALYTVYSLVDVLEIPVIGCGGIHDADSALSFIMVGAHAVQVGTASFLNPTVSIQIVEGIKKYLIEEGFGSLEEIRGILS